MKKLLFFLLVVIYTNCSDKKDIKSINQFITLFSRGDFENGIPTANDDFFFFIKINYFFDKNIIRNNKNKYSNKVKSIIFYNW